MTIAEKNYTEARAAENRLIRWLLPYIVGAVLLSLACFGTVQVLALQIDVKANKEAAAFIVRQLAADREYRRCIEERHKGYTSAEVAWFNDLLDAEAGRFTHNDAWYTDERMKAYRRRLPSVKETDAKICGDNFPTSSRR